jgi:anti-anti-sigma factor
MRRVRFAVRAHQWGPILMVVLVGDIDADAVPRLAGKLRTLQDNQSVIVDLWDVTSMDAAMVPVLVGAHERAKEARWGFAIVADPDGAACETIRAAGSPDGLDPFPTRNAARAALQLAPS